MAIIRRTAKKIPGLAYMYSAVLRHYTEFRMRRLGPERVFNEIFVTNKWRGNESISGPGSSTDQTRVIIRELPLLLRDLDAQTLLDIPCGDFNWMRNVPLENISYIGADIVEQIIKQNNEKYGNKNISFRKLDLIRDELPRTDVILCRDGIVHLSFDDAFEALRNICRSRSKYLVTTTFTQRSTNTDIITGQWRTLNLQVRPFELSSPLNVINEECTEWNGAFPDKSLGLWRIRDIEDSLTKKDKDRLKLSLNPLPGKPGKSRVINIHKSS